MYLKNAVLAARKEHASSRTGSHYYVAAFLKLHLECPVCRTNREFQADSFDLMLDFSQIKEDQRSVIGEEFRCESCGVSSTIPEQDQKLAHSTLSYRAIQGLAKKLPPALRKILNAA